MTKEIPNEEIKALFEEINRISENSATFAEPIKLPGLYKFYSYKIAKLGRFYLISSLGLPVEVVPEKVIRVSDIPPTVLFKINLEDKFFIYVQIDIEKLSQLEKLLYKGLEDKPFIDKVLPVVLSQIFSDTNLALKVEKNRYTVFFSEDVFLFSFNVFISNVSFKIDFYIEKELLDSCLIPSYILFPQTKEEKRKIKLILSMLNA